MKANPVRNPVTSRHLGMKGYGSIPSPFSIISKFRNIKTMPVLVILGLLMGGSVSFASENTVPGDILFPVKVHINERVRGAVAVTPQAKAEWELHLVERRLDEIEKLATLPEVSSDAKDIAQDNLEKYTERAKERISKFEDEDNDEDALAVAGQLTEILRAHETIISILEEDSTNDEEVSDNILVTTMDGVINATSTTGVINKENLSALKDALKTLHEAREYSEKKNKEIEHKRSLKNKEEDKEDNADSLFDETIGISDEKDNEDEGGEANTHSVPFVSTTTDKSRSSLEELSAIDKTEDNNDDSSENDDDHFPKAPEKNRN